MTVFEVGAGYETRSPGDYDTTWIFWVVARTKSFVTLRCGDDIRRVGVKTDADGEWALPLGNYSLCPVLRANRKIDTNQGAPA